MLRLELAPFGITVLTVHTGKVDSRFWDNAHKPELPPNSLYSPIAARLADAAAGKSIGPSSPVEEFARDVVKAVDAGGSGLLWKGASAGSIWWASKLMPSFILVCCFDCGGSRSKLIESVLVQIHIFRAGTERVKRKSIGRCLCWSLARLGR